MKKGPYTAVLFAVLAGFVAVCLGVPTASAQAPAPAKPVLTADDCVKCHEGPPADIARAGAAHKNVNCTFCHAGHRPKSKNNIPQCSQCHQARPHFELKGCLGCHTNPHTPLNIVLKGNITDPCLTCHTDQIKQLNDHKSKHTKLFCSTCHDAHGKKPECLQCHTPHAETMTAGDCRKCHKAHMPTEVAYGSDVLNKDCGACHTTAFSLLSASKAKHGSFACEFCHQAKHKTVPKCEDCHGVPHPAPLMQKFPKCGDCHYIAHDLNNWPKQEKKAVKRTKKSNTKKSSKKK